jgi:excisionase family DNA binding protein
MAKTKEASVLTIPETARRLRISVQSCYSAAREGSIPTIRIGHLIRVPRIALERLIAGEK